MIEKKDLNAVTKEFGQYCSSLILTLKNKTCTNLAKTFDTSHDKMLRLINNPKNIQKYAPMLLINLIKSLPTGKKGHFVCDDSVMKKIYAQLIAGVVECYDSSEQRVTQGISGVFITWTDGNIMIPIDFRFWIPEELCSSADEYRSKSDLALELIIFYSQFLDIKTVILDGLYASKKVIQRFNQENINFEMRLAKNRIVTYFDITASASKHPLLKLNRNEHSKTIKATWQTMKCFVTAEKRKNKHGDVEVVYLISNFEAPSWRHVQLYFFRWSIEKFFRTAKQYLGLQDCQARSHIKQRMHIFYVIFSYTFLQLKRKKRKHTSVESVIHELRDLKPITSTYAKTLAIQISHAFA